MKLYLNMQGKCSMLKLFYHNIKYNQIKIANKEKTVYNNSNYTASAFCAGGGNF